MERFIPVEIFRKKLIPFEVLPFSRSYRDDRDFLYHLFGLLAIVPGFMSGESEKFTGILWMAQLNPVPVFGIKKNTSTIWRKIFTEISVQMVSAQSVGRLGTEGKKEIIARLRVVLYFPSRIVERAKCERASESPIARKAPFSRGVIFTRASVSLAPLSLRENKGSTCSLDYCYFY